MKTLYVHIGIPKTATTSIQKFCSDNETVLNKHGYCYPRFPWKYTPNPTRRNGLFLYKEIAENGIRQREEEDRRRAEGFAVIQELFKTFDYVILSDEIIWHASYRRRKTIWNEIKEQGERIGFSVKIIVYLRRQDEYVSSWWNQIIKAGAKYPPTGYEETPWEEYRANIPPSMQIDYCHALEKIAAVLGKENIIVRRFERNQFYGGMIESDFLHCLGLELTDEYSISPQYSNQRLSGNTPEIKRVINSLPDVTWQEQTFFRKVLLKCSETSEQVYPCSMFSREEAIDFMKQFQAGNDTIVREYLGEEDGTPLFSTQFKETEKWKKDNPYMQDDIIRFIGESNLQLLRKIEQERIKSEQEQKKLIQEQQNLKKELEEMKKALKHPVRTCLKRILKKIRRLP